MITRFRCWLMMRVTPPLPPCWTCSELQIWENTLSSSCSTGETRLKPQIFMAKQAPKFKRYWIFPSPQVHQCCGLSGPHHAGGDSRWKRLHRLLNRWSGGAPCCLPHPLHNRTHRPTPSLRHRQHRSWSLLLDHCLHSWQWEFLFLAS